MQIFFNDFELASKNYGVEVTAEKHLEIPATIIISYVSGSENLFDDYFDWLWENLPAGVDVLLENFPEREDTYLSSIRGFIQTITLWERMKILFRKDN